MNIRALAAELIAEVIDQKRSLSDRLPYYKNKCKKESDQSLLQAITYGVLRIFPQYEFIIKPHLKKPFKPKDNVLLYLLAIGLYQLKAMRIPEHAAISETVEATRVLKRPWAAGVVNAILRELQRNQATLDTLINTNEIAKSAHPSWILDKIKQDWPAQAEQIVSINNTQPPLSLRVNQQKITREDYLNLLLQHNIEAEIIAETTQGIRLLKAQDVHTLPGFKEGFCSVQDAGAQFAAQHLSLEPHLRILDACAAPGGKTCEMLESEPTLKLFSMDISQERLEKIQENLDRLALKATLICQDAKNTSAWWNHEYYDRILLDAPCSASGVIRRHPDIKYLRNAEDIPGLVTQQLELLKALWPLLKPNGLLLYITCSIFKDENQNVIQEFLSCQTDAKLENIVLPDGIDLKVGTQILPGQNGMDGFYYARVRKIA